MKVLKFSNMHLSWIGIGSDRLSGSAIEFFASFKTFFFLFGFMGSLFGFSAVYVYKNASDVANAMNPSLVMSAGVACTGSYVCFGLKLKAMKSLHAHLQAVVDQAEDTMAFRCYTVVEMTMRAFAKYMTIYFIVSSAIFIFLLSVIHSVICMWHGNFDTSTWFLSIQMSVPFDTSSIFGWYMKWVLQACGGFVYNTSIPALVPYFVCCCFYIGACCEHFRIKYEQFDANIANHNEKQGGKFKEGKVDRIEGNFLMQFSDLVRFHVEILRIFDLVADVNSGTVFYMLFFHVPYFACILYQLEQSVNHPDFMLLFNIVGSSFSLCITFLLCYSGNRATHSLSGINATVYNSNWYQQPAKMQKYTNLIVQRSLKVAHMTGFKIFFCSLETFAKLIKTAFNFYVMFRSMQQ